MRHAVVVFPAFTAADSTWIESLRRVHDPQHGQIGPHVTVMFPFDAAADALVAHVSRVVAGHPSFEMTVTHAVAHPDQPASGSQPHITVGAGLDADACADLASDLNRHGIRATGRVDKVEIVSVGPAGITSATVRSLPT